jgi:LynF/TruF/PatF family peptide O-prenyltransferase
MNPLIRVYDFHKKEFRLKDNTFLRLFEELLATPPCSLLECCVQISPHGTHGARFRLGYEQQDIQEGFHAIYDFLHKIARCENVRLNYSMLSQIVNKDFDLSRVIALGVGLDHKTKSNDSKVKYYLLLSEYPAKVEQVISLHPNLNRIHDYLVHEECGFGINMYFDGRTGIELYPFFDRQDLNNATLMNKLKLQDVMEGLVKQCNLLHVSFENGGKRILHFNPQSPTKFVRSVGNRQLSLSYVSVQILNYLLNRSHHKEVAVMLTLRENEILSGDIQNINLQYSLSFRA